MKGHPLQSLQIVLLHLPLVPFPRWGWNLSTAWGPERRCPCTPGCGLTPAPKGEPAAPRLSLKGSSTLSTHCPPGLCQGPGGAQTTSLLHQAGKLPLPPQCCLYLLCMHSWVPALGLLLGTAKGNTALPRPRERGDMSPEDQPAAECSVRPCPSQGDSWDPSAEAA